MFHELGVHISGLIGRLEIGGCLLFRAHRKTIGVAVIIFDEDGFPLCFKIWNVLTFVYTANVPCLDLKLVSHAVEQRKFKVM